MFDGQLRIRLRRFIRELRRRKVIRAAIAYAVVGVGVAEGASIFLPALGAPAWLPNTIAVIVVLGFPVALVLSWAFDVVPDPEAESQGSEDAPATSAGTTSRLLAANTPIEGQQLGHYDIIERLGVGGMGVVYKARDMHLDRIVAFKVLSDHLLADDDARERFLVEARAAAALDHPNIGAIHEVGETDDGRFYIAMQYYDGQTLRQRIDGERIALPQALDFASQIARGLVEAAGQGIIHRDIKPANMVITADGTLKIVDFGLAKHGGVAVTHTGERMGTVAYMSPEQTRGEEVDARTDIWSLGIVLYEMVTGTRPFRGGNDAAISSAIMEGKPEPVSRVAPALPPGVGSVIERALQKDPGRRYPDSATMLRDLEQLRDDPSCQVSLDSSPSLPAEGERRRVTVLACAIEGIDSLMETMDPDDVDMALAGLEEWVRAVVDDFGGVVNEFSEDKCVTLFGVPVTHEDDRLRAVRAALVVRDGDATDYVVPEGVTIRHSVGSAQVAIRAVESGDRRYRVGGRVVADTMRLAQSAEPGEILVLPELARVVEPFVVLESRTPVTLATGQDPMTPSAVIEESGHASRLEAAAQGSLTPFVGRTTELAALSQALDDTCSGSGRFVTVIGDVGVGKSRLMHEFMQSLEGQDVRMATGRCREHGSLTPLLPFIDCMKNLLGIARPPTDDMEGTVIEQMTELAPVLSDYVPAILHLLSIDSRKRRLPDYLEGEDLQAALGEALISVFTLGAGSRPLVLLLEDWHWVDEGSREVLFQLREMVAACPVLVIVTSRPGQSGESTVPTGDLHLELAPLGGGPAAEMLSAALEGARIPTEIAERIGEKTGGNPFFIEELCRTFVESGTLVIENGEARLASDIDSLTIPDNVQAVLKSRLDRLDPEAREVLRCAAVIGRQFDSELLGRVVPSRSRLDGALDSLRAAGHIQRTGLLPSPTFRFKHALTLDVTYESLLERQRHERHAAVGEAIEELHTDRIDDFATQLAVHFAAAREWDKAIDYGMTAAKRAEGLWHLQEAVEMLKRTRAWIGHSERPTEEKSALLIQLLLDLERHLEKLARREEQQEIIDALFELVSSTPTLDRGENCVRQGDLFTLLGRFDDARPFFDEALSIADQLDDTELQGKAMRGLGHALWRQGNYHEAVPLLEKAVDNARGHADKGRLIADLCNLGRALRGQDQWDVAMAIGDEALELALSTGNPVDQLYAYNYRGHVLRAMGRTDDAIEAFQAGAGRAHDARIPAREAFCRLGAAALYLETGKLEDGLNAYSESVELARRANRTDQLAQSLVLLAEALVTCGRAREAIPSLEEAIGVLRRIGQEEPVAAAMAQLAAAQQKTGLPAAENTWREVADLQERLGNKDGHMTALEQLAGLRRAVDRSEAHWCYRRALALATELEDAESEARVRNSLGLLAWQGGELDDAEKQLNKAAGLLRRSQNTGELGVVLNGLGAVLTRLDRVVEANRVLQEALALNKQNQLESAAADSMAALGAASLASGDAAEAQTWYQQCVQLRRALGDRAGEGWALFRLAEASLQAGESQQATAYAAAALAMGREVGDNSLESLAGGLQCGDKQQESD